MMEEGNETDTANDERDNKKKCKSFRTTKDMAIDLTKEGDGTQDRKNCEKMTLTGDKEEGKEGETEADETNTIEWGIKPIKEVKKFLTMLAKNP
eukprot:2002646-Ditylum_brightwellii.AAC.1